ncbi:sirohydrochlorin chelatase [Phaeacidiphilus oryzae]|uniref:sirohydrochlorin chelatase n=1 Tax=Phaeacidiphilus oryzae TaxID=348818 RepID=UPI0005643439|nr:hypothetical protein [Phaeacidiphilus oryzae]
MSSAANPGTPLPVRTPGSRARGRHRRPERPEIPAGAPSLLLAIPAPAGPEVRAVVEEIVSVVRGEQFGIDIRAGYLSRPAAADGGAGTGGGDPVEGGSESDSGVSVDGEPTASAEPAAPVEGAPAVEESAGAAELDPRDYPLITELLAQARDAELPPPIVVPLLAGPAGDVHNAVEAALAGSGAQLVDVLGPHPLLAEAVHVRLSEAGLARADRARLFTINTAADGVVLATVGGHEGMQQAQSVTGVLLAARLAVPVLAAALDVPGSVAAAVEQLRAAGCARPALAPFLIGPEARPGALEAAAEEAGCPLAAPLGAYPGVARLVLGAYLGAIGVEMEQPAQPAPMG